MKIILSGGGTGGHIFPALSVADEIRRRYPESEILFVGALGKMEMTVVPKHGYRIEGLPIEGLYRQLTWRNVVRNLQLPFKIVRSVLKANRLLREFKPDVVVGTGGFASAAIGRRAIAAGIPVAICEQNAFPGLTNRSMARGAKRILLGNDDARKHFLAAGANNGQILFTGNPIRQFSAVPDAKQKLGFEANTPLLLVTGGSLGARTLNNSLEAGLDELLASGVQVLWQCGKLYHEALTQRTAAKLAGQSRIRIVPFIDDMNAAFAAADLVVSRAGASTISEMIALDKPSILVPSPNVAEDHQTKNALSLTREGAAVLVTDADAPKMLIPQALNLLKDRAAIATVVTALQRLPKPNSASLIVDEVEKMIQK